jgi:TatA/E family protein of Tat protein translocase
MGNFGIGEIILIIVVIYFLFGPEKLPKIIGGFGKTVGEFLKMKDEVGAPIKEVENTIKNAIQEVKAPITEKSFKDDTIDHHNITQTNKDSENKKEN